MGPREDRAGDAGRERDRSPLVSVIIPTYNRAQYVTEAVTSVTAQTYGSLQIIVIDDGSSDDTAEQLKPLLKDERIQYIYQENAGPAAARNRGLDAAAGAFIAFLDSDDLWLPRSVERRIQAFECLPASVGVVFSDYVRELAPEKEEGTTFLASAGYDEQFRTELSDAKAGNNSCLLMNDAFRELQAVQCAINTPTTMIRRSAVGDQRFDPFFRACQDWDFFTRVSLQTAVGCLLEPTARVRFWIAGTTTDGMRQTHFERILIRRHLRTFRDGGARRRVRNRIASISFQRAYHYYGKRKRAACLRECAVSVRWGYSLSRAVALAGAVLLPCGLRERIRRINPWQGRPVE